ncbi:hypothetical protein HDU88_004916 [Geranomyces variabilis]|nr:hypothetical protein HDU88_004916 [Geranomyces variabilis]
MASLASLPSLVFRQVLIYLDPGIILPRLAACARVLRHRIDEEKPILPATRRLLKALEHDLRACNLVRPSGPEWEDYYRLFEGDVLFHSPAEAAEAVIEGITSVADELPSEMARIFNQSRYVPIRSMMGYIHVCDLRLERKTVVALTLASGAKAVIGSFITLDNDEYDEYDQDHHVEIVAKLSGCDPCVVYESEENNLVIYTAQAQLAEELNVPAASVQKWFWEVGQFGCSRALTCDARINVATRLGDGPSVSSEMIKMVNWVDAHERGDLKICSTEMVAELRNVRRMVANQPKATTIVGMKLPPGCIAPAATGYRAPPWALKDNIIVPWPSLLRFVTDRRARWDSRYFVEVYDSLCAEYQDMLSSEPAARNPDAVGAWMNDHVLFKKYNVTVSNEHMPGEDLLVQFRVGTSRNAPDFQFKSRWVFEFPRSDAAKKHPCELNHWVSTLSPNGWATNEDFVPFISFLSSDKHKESEDRFWRDLRFAHQSVQNQAVRNPFNMLELQNAINMQARSDGMGTPLLSKDDVEARMMDVWRRADPHGEWGGPRRFSLLVIALTMSFVVPDAWRPNQS